MRVCQAKVDAEEDCDATLIKELLNEEFAALGEAEFPPASEASTFTLPLAFD